MSGKQNSMSGKQRTDSSPTTFQL